MSIRAPMPIRRALAGLGFGYMAALFPSLVVYLYNASALRLPLWHVWAGGLGMAVVLGFPLAAATRIPRGGGRVADLCRVGSIALFLLTLFPNATGEITGINGFLDGANDAVPLIKLGFLLALLLLLAMARRTVFDALHGSTLIVAGAIGLLALAGFRLGAPPDAIASAEEQRTAARLGPDGNVIVIVPDAFTGYRMAEVVASDATLPAAFDGFRLFPNAIACAFNTVAGISTLLTGDLDVARDPANKRQRIARMLNGSWLQEAWAKGHTVAYLSYLLPRKADFTTLNEQRYFDSSLLPATSGWNHYRMLLSLSMARILPPSWYRALSRGIAPTAPRAQAEGNDCAAFRLAYRDATQVCERSAYASALSFHHLMDRLQVTPGPPAVLFFHSQLTHAPSVFDAEGNVGQTHDVAGTMHYAARLLARLGDRLRQLGVYDSTLIIVASDHGYSPPDDPTMGGMLDNGQCLDPAFNALVLVKPPGGRGPLLIDPMPVWLGDVAATVRNHLGLPPAAGQYPVRTLLDPSDPERKLKVPVYIRPDQGAFHGSLSDWPHRVVHGGIAAFAEASTPLPPLSVETGATIWVSAGCDIRRTEGVVRGWLQGTGIQYRAAIEVDGRLAVKCTDLGGLVGLRIGADDGAMTLYRDRSQVIEQLHRDFDRDRLVFGGVALSRADLAALHPTVRDALPAEGDRFNLSMIAGGPSNGLPMIRMATNDVQIMTVW